MSEIDLISSGLRERAQLVVETFNAQFHIPLNYDADSISSIEVYLELIRDLLTEENIEEFVTSIGAYLGECLVRLCGGVWTNESGWWGVQLAEGVIASPFVQVRSQLNQGLQQSIVRYFACLLPLAKHLSRSRTLHAESDQHLGLKLLQEMKYWSDLSQATAMPGSHDIDARKAM